VIRKNDVWNVFAIVLELGSGDSISTAGG